MTIKLANSTSIYHSQLNFQGSWYILVEGTNLPIHLNSIIYKFYLIKEIYESQWVMKSRSWDPILHYTIEVEGALEGQFLLNDFSD